MRFDEGLKTREKRCARGFFIGRAAGIDTATLRHGSRVRFTATNTTSCDTGARVAPNACAAIGPCVPSIVFNAVCFLQDHPP
ncbi:hypothetical protein [Burkholderia sp. JKS000303]|uniref:hypothetical protein n=1 Tax=Burkholderia sp. JKS000303 TaxID=1938747 RepID=UPI0015CEF8F3|nr:hypothetical protein [Burkholderia sp. JKS000303]